MSNRDHRTGGPGLRILLSRATVSRRGFLLSSLAGATGLAIEGGRAPAMAAEGSVRSLTYSGQRWGAVQEAMAPAFTKATGIQTKIITFPISQGYARILTPLGIGSSEYDLIELDYGILAQVADKLTPLDAYLQKDAAYKAEYEARCPPTCAGCTSSTALGWARARPTASPTTPTRSSASTAPTSSRRPHQATATWDEAQQVAKELTVSTAAGKQYGFTTNGKRGIYSSTLFGQVLFSFGGNWLDDSNAPTLTTPEAEAALETIKKLMEFADPSVVNSGDNETINAMASGVAVYSPNAWGNNAFTNPKLNKLAGVTKAVRCPEARGPRRRTRRSSAIRLRHSGVGAQ